MCCPIQYFWAALCLGHFRRVHVLWKRPALLADSACGVVWNDWAGGPEPKLGGRALTIGDLQGATDKSRLPQTQGLGHEGSSLCNSRYTGRCVTTYPWMSVISPKSSNTQTQLYLTQAPDQVAATSQGHKLSTLVRMQTYESSTRPAGRAAIHQESIWMQSNMPVPLHLSTCHFHAGFLSVFPAETGSTP